MLNFILLQVAEATTAVSEEIVQEPGFMEKYGSLLMIIGIFVVFYFFMIRPQQKRQKEIQKMRDALGKGDTVITAGGIYGKIKEVSDKYFLVEVANGVTLRVDKGSVYVSAEDVAQASQSESK